jgi:WD40 repeat protein
MSLQNIPVQSELNISRSTSALRAQPRRRHPTKNPPHSVSLPTLTHHLFVSQKAVVESYSYRTVFIMSGPEVHHLFHRPIADHSFSADRQTLAVARDNNVDLYQRSGNKLVLKDELKGHDKTVTSVDIAPSSGMIVTCSQGLC